MIAIIDYGLGNVKAFSNVFSKLNIPVIIAKEPDDLKNVTKVILPGVGAFDFAMHRLEASGMKDNLNELATKYYVPILGICVGMQMLGKFSEEGKLPGLGWIDGNVRKFKPPALTPNTLLPHMGWNDIVPLSQKTLFNNIGSDSRFYFLHSYYFHCNNPEDILATTDYGGEFASAIQNNNIYGVQFHPEKSHQWGVQLLKNFAEI